MTPEQEALVEALKSVAEQGEVPKNALSSLCEALIFYSRHPSPASRQYVVTPTVNGRLILALAAERDELKTALDLERLKSAWLEARIERADAALDLNSAREEGVFLSEVAPMLSELVDAENAENKARAAYVAAGGVV